MKHYPYLQHLLGICLCLGTLFVSGQDKVNVEGSWEMIRFIDHANQGTDWIERPAKVIKQKHITDTHFSWFEYDSENNELIGMGGGTYIIDENNNYVENINFFYPPGSSILGQTIPFTVEFKKGNWMHTGYAKETEVTSDGTIQVTGSVKIEEVWSPLTPKSQNNPQLIGSWSLSSYRDNPDDEYIEYPGCAGYLKLITPTHFIWIQYDVEGDQIFGSGSGTYICKDNSYQEVLVTHYPTNTFLLNKNLNFKLQLSDYRWNHYGYIPSAEGKQELIDEIWVPYSSSISDETAFGQ